MKRKLLVIFGVLVLVLTGGWFLLTNTIIKMVTHFEPYTFEKVLSDDYLIDRYGIGDARSPKDYGYEETEEVIFYSYLDSMELSGWFVRSSPSSKKTVILLHGRTSNRLKTMKYLKLFQDVGLDTVYNFFIPDLRNSGKSPEAITFMGYKFAEDIGGAIQFLKKARQQDQFVLYGFSMGAMAISAAMHRKDVGFEHSEIERIILDSPLSNAKENLRGRAVELGLPDVIFDNVYDEFSEEIDGYGENLKFSITLRDVSIPIFVIQSNDDESTPAKLTKIELNQLSEHTNIQTWFMDGPRHVGIYKSPDWNEEYTQRVAEFIQ